MLRAANVIVGLGVVAIVGCGRNGELREWTPADHGGNESAPEGATDPIAAATPSGMQAAVAAIWAVRCAKCHGDAGRGDGPEPPPGASMPDMSDPAWQAAQTDDAMTVSIRDGKNDMPAFAARIRPEGIAGLVARVRGFASSALSAQPASTGVQPIAQPSVAQP